jgi:hypothetical protein
MDEDDEDANDSCGFALRDGRRVRRKYRSCQRRFTGGPAEEVQTIPEWGGLQNPGGPYRTLLLSLTDGGDNFDDSPFAVERTLLTECPGRSDGGCGGSGVIPGTYAFTFRSKASPDGAVQVRMGETKNAPLQSPKGVGTVMVHNLRSYQSTFCYDDAWNYAYYMYWQPPTR